MTEKLSLFRTTRRILFGVGSAEKTGTEAQLLKAKKALIITDPGVIQAGLLEGIEKSLQSVGIPFAIFDGVEPDPRIEVVEKSVEKAKKEGMDLIIGFGGGSSLDIAKVTSILITNPGKIDSFFGIDLVPRPGVPVILIPTTAGTGSEVTPIAILSDTKEKLKKGIVTPHLFPEVAIVDPKLTVGLPPSVTAFTGMDALTHAIEAFYSINATDLSDLLALRAMELLSKNLRMAYAHGENIDRPLEHDGGKPPRRDRLCQRRRRCRPCFCLSSRWRISSCSWTHQYIDASLCDALQYAWMSL